MGNKLYVGNLPYSVGDSQRIAVGRQVHSPETAANGKRTEERVRVEIVTQDIAARTDVEQAARIVVHHIHPIGR